MLGKKQIIEIYRKRAGNYDWTANLYYLLGYREVHYRRLAVRSLGLSPGDSVLELGCGTGLNFSHLRNQAREQGRIIGLDLTDAMLDQARRRAEENAWENVELIHGDMVEIDYPSPLDGVISTFALSLVPDIQRAVHKAHGVLRPGGRLVILDLREPDNFLKILRPLILPVERPFGVTAELVEARPWEKVESALREEFKKIEVTSLFGGFTFLARAEKA